MNLIRLQEKWKNQLPSEANGLVAKRKSKFRYARITKNNKEAKQMIEEGYKIKMIHGYIVGFKLK